MTGDRGNAERDDRERRLEAHDGGRIVYRDGTYHYRAPDGVAMCSLWVPPSASPLRGVFINGNPGGIGGDNRRFTRDATFRAYAARLGFALMGLHSMPAREVNPRLAKVVFAVMDDFAEMGLHPEIRNLPMVTLGNSNGGMTSYRLTHYAPERAICFAMNVGRLGKRPSEAMLEVPGFIVVGPEDGLIGTDYPPLARERVTDARSRGARWAYLEEQGKGHEVGRIFDYQMVFFEQCIRRRLPELGEPGGDPRKGPVDLKPIALSDGWLVDHGSWASGLTRVAPYDRYTGPRHEAGWVPTADLAMLYRGLATYDNPLSLTLSARKPESPNPSGRFLTEVGGPLVEPALPVDLTVDASGLSGWRRIDVYEGARRVVSVTPDESGGETVSVTVRPSLEHVAWAYTVEAIGPEGDVHTATPRHVVVRDPSIALPELVDRLPVRVGAPRSVTPEAAGDGRPSEPDPGDAVLVAHRLTEDQERLADADGTDLWAFWEDVGQDGDRIALRGGSAEMAVYAAAGERGLYLLFEVADDAFVEAGTGLDVWGRDAVDVMLDNRSCEEIWAEPRGGTFVNAGWSLTQTTVQIQSPFGTLDEPGTEVRCNWPDPFEFRWNVVSRRRLRRELGVRIEHVGLLSRSERSVRRAQQWLVPWNRVGTLGFAGRPGSGTRFAFCVGYNDLDGERRGGLRWLGDASPWGHSWLRGRKKVWGEIEVGRSVGGLDSAAGGR